VNSGTLSNALHRCFPSVTPITFSLVCNLRPIVDSECGHRCCGICYKSAALTVVEHLGGRVGLTGNATDAHCALILSCWHSLKLWMTSQLVQNKDYHSLWLSRCLACTTNAGCTVRISSTGNLVTILTNFRGYKTLRPRLTKYWRLWLHTCPRFEI